MKSDTTQILTLARIIYDEAQRQCLADDKFVASAGLIRLQDFLELVFYAILIELGIDETSNIESLSFDEMISKIKNHKKNIVIIKSGTLKALNKQRVLIKHYGQLAEPETVHRYLDAATKSTDNLLIDVVGKPLQAIMLYEVIRDEQVKEFLETSRVCIDNGEFFESLAATRKAIYITIEEDYSIEGWKDHPAGAPYPGLLAIPIKGGDSAPYYCKNKDWIEKNVKDPFDYIRLDHDKIRADLMEWGVQTQDYWNIWRLTPPVFRFRETKEWVVKIDPDIIKSEDIAENAKYCLDRAMSIIIAKQNHTSSRRYLKNALKSKARVLEDQDVYEKASNESKVVGKLTAGMICNTLYATKAFSGSNMFFNIIYISEEKDVFIIGYVPIDAIEIIG